MYVVQNDDNMDLGWMHQNISFCGVKLGVRELELIYQAIVKDRKVKDLVLHMCQIDEEGLIEILKKIPSTSPINARFIYSHLTERTAIALATAVQASSIKSIDLTYNNIGPKGAIALAHALRGSSVEDLLLSEYDISLEATQGLTQVLSEGSTCLKSLDLSKNNIGDEGVVALAKALPNTRIEELKLNMNEITEVGVAEICNAVKSTPTLVELYLGGNNLTDTSAKFLAETIRSCPLKKLNLNLNKFTDKGVAYLAEAIAESITLEHLDLRGNREITSASADVGYWTTSPVSSLKLTRMRHKL